MITYLWLSGLIMSLAKITVPTPNEWSQKIAPTHPRLLATSKDFQQLKIRIQKDAQTREFYRRLKEAAEGTLKDSPARYEIPDGLRLLATSRQVLSRIYTLALIYRLDEDKRYLDRAWKELQAAANFPDWNPRHFLDTAEMSHAFAIGYDWLYEAWTEGQRKTLRQAMATKGLQPALEVYRGQGWWAKARNNWNQVCNGGIGMAALALVDELPDLCGEILTSALQSLQLPMSQFAPDGAWNEGPGYWNYATNYNVIFLAALEKAVGTDFNLSQIAGFSETGLFPLYITGPLGRTFNFADAGDGTLRAPQMFWLARKFNRPIYAWYARTNASVHALDLLWLDSRSNDPHAERLPLDKHFRGVEVATFRSAWSDRNALFIGFKVGDNKASHSHLDIGTFVLDALGYRWALDLGADNYNLPGYFGNQRWTYYRLRAEGHNTLVLNPSQEPDQDPKAAVSIRRFRSQLKKAFAIADLTPAYGMQVKRVERGIAFLERRQAMVQDEISFQEPGEVWWFMHTSASIQLSDERRTATLSQGEARLWCAILTPEDASFSVMDAQPLPTSPNPEGQNPNTGLRKLAIHLSNVSATRLAVMFVPLRQGEIPPSTLLPVKPLAEW